eukprot:3217702-Rhodomonas_salina.2
MLSAVPEVRYCATVPWYRQYQRHGTALHYHGIGSTRGAVGRYDGQQYLSHRILRLLGSAVDRSA